MKTTPARVSRVLLLLTGLVLAGCATTTVPLLHQPVGVPVTQGDFADSTATELTVTKAVRLLELASPESLAEAARILASSDMRGVHRVAKALGLGARLWRLLYPETATPFPVDAETAARDGGSLSRFLDLVEPGLLLLDAGAGPRATPPPASDLAEAAALNPDSPLAPLLQGLRVLSTDGALPDARSCFDEALRRAPGFTPAARQAAVCILRGGTAAGEWDLFRGLVSLLPTAAERFTVTARGALAAGKPEEAADAAAQAFLAAPDVGVALLRAEALEAQGDWYKAVWIADVVLKVRPGLPEAQLMKARLLFEQEQDGVAALRLLDAAVVEHPRDAAMAHLRGRILVAEGRTAEGVAELMRSLDLSPGRHETVSLLLRVAADAEDWEGASLWLSRIPEPERTAEDLTAAWRMSMQTEDFTAAVGHAHAMRAKGDPAEAMGMEAFALLAAGDAEQARAIVDEALPLAGTPTLRGSLYLIRSSADSEDPLQDLRLALREEPDNREALAAIMDLLTQAGEYRKALEYARHAAAVSPDDAELAQTVADLEKRAVSGE